MKDCKEHGNDRKGEVEQGREETSYCDFNLALRALRSLPGARLGSWPQIWAVTQLPALWLFKKNLPLTTTGIIKH